MELKSGFSFEFRARLPKFRPCIVTPVDSGVSRYATACSRPHHLKLRVCFPVLSQFRGFDWLVSGTMVFFLTDSKQSKLVTVFKSTFSSLDIFGQVVVSN
jgi:hypothetical protein